MAIAELLDRLRSGGEHELYPVASAEDLEVTARAVGGQLSPAFVAFVTGFSNGAYLYGVQEVGAVGDGNAQVSAIHRNVEDSAEPLAGREGLTVGDLIPFALDSNGMWCFVPDGSAEPPVAYHTYGDAHLYCELAGFEQWLGVVIDSQEEAIRAVANDDDLEALGLG